MYLIYTPSRPFCAGTEGGHCRVLVVLSGSFASEIETAGNDIISWFSDSRGTHCWEPGFSNKYITSAVTDYWTQRALNEVMPPISHNLAENTSKTTSFFILQQLPSVTYSLKHSSLDRLGRGKLANFEYYVRHVRAIPTWHAYAPVVRDVR